jgi:molecular chaperone DnaK
VLSVRDGEFIVVNHAGDNFLGGKLIDWAIVEDVLIPAAREAHGLHTPARGNKQWRKTVAKLKTEAELAKIKLSRYESAKITAEIDDGRAAS